MKSALTGVLAAVVMTSALLNPLSIRSAKADGIYISYTTVLLIGLTLTTILGDVQNASHEGLIDQAYTGAGADLEAVARATGRSVEDVAQAICTLDSSGAFEGRDAEAMAQLIAARLANQ